MDKIYIVEDDQVAKVLTNPERKFFDMDYYTKKYSNAQFIMPASTCDKCHKLYDVFDFRQTKNEQKDSFYCDIIADFDSSLHWGTTWHSPILKDGSIGNYCEDCFGKYSDEELNVKNWD